MYAASANQKAIFSKILVAIDSSDASMDAADYATAAVLAKSVMRFKTLKIVAPSA
jgi:hypothetical protein